MRSKMNSVGASLIAAVAMFASLNTVYASNEYPMYKTTIELNGKVVSSS